MPFVYAQHGRYLRDESSPWTLTRRTTSQRQLRKRERTWEGSRRAKSGLDGQESRREAWEAG